MPTDIKLLVDEDVHLALADALRRRGHDAVHVREVDRLGLDDESQLKIRGGTAPLLRDVQRGRVCSLAYPSCWFQ